MKSLWHRLFVKKLFCWSRWIRKAVQEKFRPTDVVLFSGFRRKIGDVTSVVWHGSKLATGGRDRRINIFQFSADFSEFENVFQMNVHSSSIHCLHWIVEPSSGACLVSGSSDRTICHIECSGRDWSLTSSMKTNASPYCMTGAEPFIAIGKTIQLFAARKLKTIFNSSKCSRFSRLWKRMT